MMFIIIVVVFIVCHSVRVAFGKLSVSKMQYISLFVVINSSVNILIYCFKDEKFRHIAHQKFGLDKFGLCCKQAVKENDLPLQVIDKTDETGTGCTKSESYFLSD